MHVDFFFKTRKFSNHEYDVFGWILSMGLEECQVYQPSLR